MKLNGFGKMPSLPLVLDVIENAGADEGGKHLEVEKVYKAVRVFSLKVFYRLRPRLNAPDCRPILDLQRRHIFEQVLLEWALLDSQEWSLQVKFSQLKPLNGVNGRERRKWENYLLS
jgi:hypothetical protein